MNYKLPDLNYAYDALEPYMDAETVRIHHTKHHQKYVDKFNETIKDIPLGDEGLEQLFPRISKLPDAVAKNGGQAYNHSLFWESLSPKGKKIPEGALAESIINDFGSITDFKDQFNSTAAAIFGSGWAWLTSVGSKLKIVATSNHINPLMDVSEEKGKPLFCIDVWEHAYYLKYQNKRPDYLEAMWNIINWEEVERKFAEG